MTTKLTLLGELGTCVYSIRRWASVAVDGKRMEVGSLRCHQVDVSSLTRLSLCDIQGYISNFQKNAQQFLGDGE